MGTRGSNPLVTKNRNQFEEYQNFLTRLLNAKYIVENFDEYEEKYKEKFKNSGPAKTVTFQVTDNCNLQCTYCYQINKGKRKMTFETAKKFFDVLVKESYEPGSFVYIENTPGLVIEFIGGEPLLEIDLIDEICEYIKWKLISENHPWANKFLFSMISNGVEYFDPKVQDFITRNNDRLSFGISLDGCKPLHDMCRVFPDGLGSYDIAEAGCIHYKQTYNERMLTKMTICPENLTWTHEAFLNLVRLGYPVIHANCVYEKGWTVNHATILYDQLKKIADYILDNDLENSLEFTMFDEKLCKPQSLMDNKNYCGSTGCMLCCDPDGNVAPCIRFLKSSLGEDVGDFTIGHADVGLGKLDIDKHNIETLDAVTRQSQSSQECMECPISAGCGWCTAYNYQETGSVDKRCTYICWTHRARALANTYYWNKVHIKNNEPDRFRCCLQKDLALQIISEEEYNMLLDLADGQGEIPEDILLEFVYSEKDLGEFIKMLNEEEK